MLTHTRYLLALVLISGAVFAPHADAAPAKKPAPVEPVAMEEEYAGDSDPIYPFNRAMFEFNRGFDTVLLRPITQGYRYVTPAKGQEMVSNAVRNLYLPVNFANSVLQADPQNSFATFWTFTLNSTFGVAGMFDVASEAGLKYRATDFGQTLAMYGADAGPYIVLPIIGPSNFRDATGRLADALLNPFNYVEGAFSPIMWGVTAVDKRSQNMKLIDDIYTTSLDPYSTFKSGYPQHRSAEVRRAKMARSQSRHSSGLE